MWESRDGDDQNGDNDTATTVIRALDECLAKLDSRPQAITMHGLAAAYIEQAKVILLDGRRPTNHHVH